MPDVHRASWAPTAVADHGSDLACIRAAVPIKDERVEVIAEKDADANK
jgi:hypothetical protein